MYRGSIVHPRRTVLRWRGQCKHSLGTSAIRVWELVVLADFYSVIFCVMAGIVSKRQTWGSGSVRETCQYGNLSIWKLVNMVTCQYGNLPIR